MTPEQTAAYNAEQQARRERLVAAFEKAASGNRVELLSGWWLTGTRDDCRNLYGECIFRGTPYEDTFMPEVWYPIDDPDDFVTWAFSHSSDVK